MSCWFSQSHLLKKILYTELKETDFIKLQLDCQLSNRLIPVLQAHDLYHVGVISLIAIHFKEMKITKKKVLSLLPGLALIISFISFTSIQRCVRKLLKYQQHVVWCLAPIKYCACLRLFEKVTYRCRLLKFSQGIRNFIQPLHINVINLHLSFIGIKFLQYINDYGIMDNWDG